MMILTRKPGEQIVISGGGIRHGGITITVLGGTGRVKLGIEAPEDVEVDRKEVAVRKGEEKLGEAA